MRKEEFIEKNIEMPVISSKDFPLISDNPEMLRVQVHRWVKEGTLIQLKRGLYLLNVPGVQKPPDFFLSNRIIFPSYVSMESALSYYDLIPEAVYPVVSVTTRKTNRFDTKAGSFFYHHVKKELFTDYKELEIEGYSVNIATKEKSILDYLYLKYIDVEELGGLRLQNLDVIDEDKLKNGAISYPERVNKMAEVIYERVH